MLRFHGFRLLRRRKDKTAQDQHADWWLVAGLGNPGARYAQTWHNCGYRALQKLAEHLKIKVNRVRFQGLCGTGRIDRNPVLLLLPTTFMNASGQAVREAAAFYRIPPERCLVLFDDLDLPRGTIRIRPNGGSGTHNGMKSLVSLLGEGFPRIRIGIGPKPAEWNLVDFVLADVPEEERIQMAEAEAAAAQAAMEIVSQGVAVAISRLNPGRKSTINGTLKQAPEQMPPETRTQS